MTYKNKFVILITILLCFSISACGYKNNSCAIKLTNNLQNKVNNMNKT